MTEKQLRKTISEIIKEETQTDVDIEDKIDEFGELSDEMDRVKSRLEKLKKQYLEIESELRPVLEELTKHNQKSITTGRYLITLKRMGYHKENYKYKEVFNKSLTKVNQQTRRLLEELLHKTKTITQVSSSIGVQPVREGFISDLIKKVKSLFRGIIPSIRKTNKEIDNLQKITQRMMK
jgi:septal ring factor EnvC (AmiA/AmiB activator)